MGEKIRVIVPVGKSLIESYKREKLETLKNEYCIKLRNKTITDDEKNSCLKNLCQILGDECDYINQLDNWLETWFKNYNKGIHGDKYPCAEIQSLLLLFQSIGNNTEVSIFFCPTNETKEYAEKLKNAFNSNKKIVKTRCLVCIKNILCLSPFNIDVTNGQIFKNGLLDLVEKLDRQISAAKKNRERVFVNITGGYKGIIPITSILGFLDEEVKLFYVHEDSNSVIPIPSLPVSWDIRKVDELRGLLKQKSIGRTEYNILPERWKDLFDKTNDNYKKNAFGSIIEIDYDKNRSRRYGYGYYLMEYFKKEEYKKLLEEKLPYWEYLWIGDQIPETVEHAKGHSLRLMEMLYYLLKAYDSLYQKIGEDAGLYLLLCAIWLHDIGHSALGYKNKSQIIPVYLMPSLVREWHHFLSAQMIRNGCYLKGDKEGKELVALISEYHRKKMPLAGGNGIANEYGLRILTNKILPLSKRVNNSVISDFGNSLNQNNILLITALLRLLDACDVQADRVVDEYYKKMRRERTKKETEFYKSRLRKMGCELKNNEKSFIQKCSKDSFTKEEMKQIDDCLKKIVEEQAKDFNTFRADPNKFQELEVLSLRNKIIFKAKQRVDFEKHSAIRFVYPKKEGETLKVCLFVNEKTDILNLVEDDIKGEYEEIKKILIEIGIEGLEVVPLETKES